MNVFEYTAINNPSGTKRLIESYGVAPANPVLSKQLAGVLSRDRENGLAKLRTIHPDLSLFQDELDTLKSKIKSEFEQKKQEFSNANGQAIKSELSSLKESVSSPREEGKSKQELMIIGGVIIIGLAIIFKNK